MDITKAEFRRIFHAVGVAIHHLNTMQFDGHLVALGVLTDIMPELEDIDHRNTTIRIPQLPTESETDDDPKVES